MNRSSKGFTLIELMIVIAIVALVAGIATARFAVSQARSKQSEAMTNLKAMFAAEKAFSAEKGHFSVLVHEIGFSPERNNRYAYFVGAAGTLTGRSAANGAEAPGAADTGIEYDAFKYGSAAPSAFLPAINTVVAAPPCTAALGNPGLFIDAHGSQEWSGQAQGQIDDDPTYDLWTISTANRVAAAGGSCDSPGAWNPRGEPLVETNDVIR